MTIPLHLAGRPGLALAINESRDASVSVTHALAEAPPPPPAAPEPVEAEGDEGMADERPWPPPSLLVVDDDTVVRETMRDLLRDMGMEVVGEAENGAEGVRMAIELRPDVVLMDLRMPGVGGLEATSQIKAVNREVQVIVLTAYDDPALKSGAVKAGVYAYLVKGCPPWLIADVVGRACAMKRSLEAE